MRSGFELRIATRTTDPDTVLERTRREARIAIIIGILAVTGLSVGAFYARRGEAAPAIVTASVTRGPIVNAIAATGTLEAVTTVQVGSQVSGTIQALDADFNSIVRKGQVIARLDPSLFQTQVDSARANLTSAQADLQRAEVTLGDAQTKATRAHQLADEAADPDDRCRGGGRRASARRRAGPQSRRPSSRRREPRSPRRRSTCRRRSSPRPSTAS